MKNQSLLLMQRLNNTSVRLIFLKKKHLSSTISKFFLISKSLPTSNLRTAEQNWFSLNTHGTWLLLFNINLTTGRKLFGTRLTLRTSCSWSRICRLNNVVQSPHRTKTSRTGDHSLLLLTKLRTWTPSFLWFLNFIPNSWWRDIGKNLWRLLRKTSNSRIQSSAFKTLLSFSSLNMLRKSLKLSMELRRKTKSKRSLITSKRFGRQAFLSSKTTKKYQPLV